MPNLGHLGKACLKQAEWFCVACVPVEVVGPKAQAKAKKVRGREALEYHYSEVLALSKKPKATWDIHKLRELKQFAWMLAPAQRVEVHRWLQLAVKSHMDSSGHAQLKDGPSGGELCTISAQLPSSSSSDPPPQVAQPPSKKAKSAQVNITDKKAMVDRFFRPRAVDKKIA